MTSELTRLIEHVESLILYGKGETKNPDAFAEFSEFQEVVEEFKNHQEQPAREAKQAKQG